MRQFYRYNITSLPLFRSYSWFHFCFLLRITCRLFGKIIHIMLEMLRVRYLLYLPHPYFYSKSTYLFFLVVIPISIAIVTSCRILLFTSELKIITSAKVSHIIDNESTLSSSASTLNNTTNPPSSYSSSTTCDRCGGRYPQVCNNS